jgi:hypothetical protein
MGLAVATLFTSHRKTTLVLLSRSAGAFVTFVHPLIHHSLCIANPRGSRLQQTGASPQQNYISDTFTSPDVVFTALPRYISHSHDHSICRSTDITMSDSINWGTLLSDLVHVGEGEAEAEQQRSPAQSTYDPVSEHVKDQLRCSRADHSSTILGCTAPAQTRAKKNCTTLHLTATLGPWPPLQNTPTCRWQMRCTLKNGPEWTTCKDWCRSSMLSYRMQTSLQ